MPKITKLSQLDLNAEYSDVDYFAWQLSEAVELIKGKIFPMSPAPNVKHQRISRDLSYIINTFFRYKSCELFIAPFDVHLSSNGSHSVVQPDLCVVCDKQKLTTQACVGAPDWIIEILSEGNSKKEIRLKYQLYEESGVSEYWLVYPYEQVISQFFLNGSNYVLKSTYAEDEIAIPILFPDLKINLAEIFKHHPIWK
jgi:Uma2 family endonuclease